MNAQPPEPLHPLLQVGNWQPCSPAEMTAAWRRPMVKEQTQGRIGTKDLYCYLKARFGRPNGMGMDQRVERLDSPYQWSWSLKGDGLVMWVQCQFSQVTVHLFTEVAPGPEEWSNLFEIIRADMKAHGSKLQAVRRELDHWKLVVNPYRLLECQAERSAKLIRDRAVSRPDLTKGSVEECNEAYGNWLSSALDSSVESGLLRIIAPIMGEAFVNLVLYVLAHDDVRHDARNFNALLADPIDVRVRRLYRTCHGFRVPIDTEGEAFKKFHSLMNRRNTLLHGNVAPDDLAFDDMWVDREGWIPLFKDERSLLERLIAGISQRADSGQALEDLAAVREFVDYVRSHLNADECAAVGRVAMSTILGWHKESRWLTTVFDDRMTGLAERM